MGSKNTAQYDSDEGHPWNDVMDKADTISRTLHKDGFSAQDIAHIGLRLTHIGNFMWQIEGNEYLKNKKSEDGGVE